MHRLIVIVLVFAFLGSAGPSGFSQLRNLSPYLQDRINAEHTFFILKDDAGSASFGWAFEWTHLSVNAYADKQAIFVWHFKDGTKTYSLLGETIGEAGMVTSYLVTSESQNLEDARRQKKQPMTRSNYPVKIEFCIGEVGTDGIYKPEMLVDAACFDGSGIEYGHTYHFAECKSGEGLTENPAQ